MLRLRKNRNWKFDRNRNVTVTSFKNVGRNSDRNIGYGYDYGYDFGYDFGYGYAATLV
jgi:hypothetical protein